MSELMDAAHSCGSYLYNYEQLSVVVDMTSAITYLHELLPRPYVHGDIRPTNALVTKDMRVKVADLGAAHLLEISRSSQPQLSRSRANGFHIGTLFVAYRRLQSGGFL